MKIGVIGLGLIGGSIFKNLKEQGFDVIGISKSQSGENITSDWNDLKSCNVVFVCTPMNKCLAALDKLEEILPAETVVTDVCSLKNFVCKKARSYKFIPSHPMAGTEKKGFENSFPEMFSGAIWVLTPVFGDDGMDILTDLITKMGAQTLVTTPDRHDEAAALISHMPMIIAQALFLAASDNELALKMASSGFRDMTRLALSNEEMALDMFNMNSQNIETAILKLYKSVGELTHGDYKNMICSIKEQREKMF
ncbi:prephenate dehydrogenase/arogenate dehydrogenase family protein [bacterium]|nr:prephenate dehydrogenase/arogenate dehydrogenase family protein [bacterium]